MAHDDPWTPTLRAAAQAYVEWAREYHYGEWLYLKIDRYFLIRILAELAISQHRADEVSAMAEELINEEIRRKNISLKAKSRLLGES